MKKLLAILMAICMLASVIYVPAIAAESTEKAAEKPAAGVVLRLGALKTGETPP